MAEPVAESPTEDVNDFTHATRVEGGAGKYVAEVNPHWDGPLTTHGGVLAGLMINACEAEVNADRSLQIRTLASQYLRPPAHGAVDINVRALRAGRRFTNLAVDMTQNNKLCVTALATYGSRDIDELLAFGPRLPDVAPAPERDAPVVEPHDWTDDSKGWLGVPEQAPKFFQRVLIAPRFGAGPFQGETEVGYGPLHTGGWIRTRTPRRIDDAYLALLVDIFWPTVLAPLRTPAIAPTLDLTTHFRSTLPPEGLDDQPLLVHNTTIAAGGGIAESDSLVFTADGQLLAQARQLMLLTAVQI